jgi:hypothetical protein
MNYYAYPGSSKDIEKRVLQFSKHPAQFQYQNKTFISTFSGEVPGTFMVRMRSFGIAISTYLTVSLYLFNTCRMLTKTTQPLGAR